MARLYADENFDHRIVEKLRRLGHDVLTPQEVGQAGLGIEDPDVLAYAIQRSRAVITFNRRHFRRLHIQVRPHCGIVSCTKDSNKLARAVRIHLAIKDMSTLDNQLIRIYRPSKP